MTGKRCLVLGFGVLLAGVQVSACGLNPQKNYQIMRPMLVKHDYVGADKHLEGVKTSFYSQKNRLLFYMDKSMVLSLAKNYEESNKFLEQAKLAGEELWTESIGEHAASWATTDNSLAYQGQDFERVMLHIVGAMNYISLGRYENARVEARQVANKLEVINRAYESGSKNTYRDDGFARWLSGKLGETAGGFESLNSAWIDYSKAVEVYAADYTKKYGMSLPRFVIEDALRVAEGLGPDFQFEFDQLRSKYPQVTYLSQQERGQLGEVILLHLSGEAPYKVDKFWTAVVPDGVIRIAYPKFVAKPHRIARATVRHKAANVAQRSELAQDITAIAMQDLRDHLGRIKAKAITRSVAKYIASKGLQAGGKKVAKGSSDAAKGVGAAMQLAGILFNVGSAIAEEADKRSWITLPARINVARIFVPPGRHDLQVAFETSGGNAVEVVQFEVVVEPGQTAFVRHRTYQ